MKKIFSSCLLLSSFLMLALACGHKTNPLAPANQAHFHASDLTQTPPPTFTPGPQMICYDSAQSGYAPATQCNTLVPPGCSSLGVGDVSITTNPIIDQCPCGTCGGCVPTNNGIGAGVYTFNQPFTVPPDPSQVTVAIGVNGAFGGNSVTIEVNGAPDTFTGGFSYDFTLNQVVGAPTSPIHLSRGGNTISFVDNFDGAPSSGLVLNWSVCVNWFGQPLPPTATPTNTPTGTLSPTLTPTPTPTGTLSPTLTPTPTGTTTTPTDTPTFTLSPTPTGTQSMTPSPSPSGSPSPSPSGSPTPSGTQTMTPSGTQTASTTPTSSATQNETNSPSETASQTPSVTGTQTQGTPSTTPTPTCPGGGYSIQPTPYLQTDPRWANDQMDDTQGVANEIKNSGCLMTCIGILGGEDPSTMNTTLTDDGDINSQNARLDAKGAADAVGLTYNGSVAYSENELLSQFNSGNDVVVGLLHNTHHSDGTITRDPHFVVVTGVGINPVTHQCDFTIDDPAGRFQFLSTYVTNSSQNGQLTSIRSFTP